MGTSQIERFVATLSEPWQQEACKTLLEIMRDTAPMVTMAIKWEQPFFAYHGAVLKWFVAKDWINVYFYKGFALAVPEGLFQPTKNKTMRTFRIFKGDVIPKKAFADLLQQAVALQEAKKHSVD